MKIGIVVSGGVAGQALADVVRTAPGNEVIWSTTDGREAGVRCERHLPDLVLLDMLLTGLDPVQAVQQIMSSAPCAILLLTTTGRGNKGEIFRAMSHGALDVVSQPVLQGGAVESGATEMLDKITRIGRLVGATDRVRATAATAVRARPMLVLGASTGGPQALLTLLSALPADFAAPVVVIQHVDARFASGLADWLDAAVPMPVAVAEPGARLEPGRAVIAQTNDHLTLNTRGQVAYVSEPVDLVYRPSVDVFCASVATSWCGVAVLLTGLGRDGAAGLLAMRNEGWHTIAQDEATSVVYGMPRLANELGAAAEVLPLDRIASSILTHFAAKFR
jgi:chemotaxis response regulator CheB